MSKHLERAVVIAGSQSALARAIDRSPTAIWKALKRGGKVSAEDAIAIEKATGAKVTRAQLRPDIFGGA